MRSWKRTVALALAGAACQAEPGTSTAGETTTATDDASGTSGATSSGAASDASDASGPTGPDDPTAGVTEAEASSSTGEPPAPVHGLRATYWATYLDPVLTRVDPTLDFDWGDGAPGEALGVDRFSARWSGTLLPPETGTYTLATETDDGVRVWIDDALVIDDWNGHFVTRNEVALDLAGGTEVALRIEYFELDLASSARLLWSREGVTEEVIPSDRLLAASGPDELGPPKPPYGNPVLPQDCPDPGVLANEEADGTNYYMVCTGGSFPIRRSRDLVLWQDTGAAVLPNGKPAWAANGFRNWAPELHRVGGKVVAYFTTVNGADVLSVGAAQADGPLGPYAEAPGPLVEHPVGVIDATYYEDAGTPYLLYKIDGNSKGQPTPIFIRQLAPDGLAFADGSAEVQILVNDGASWEGGVVEAPWLVQRDGTYYLFYSGNVYDHRYRTGVARAPGLLGPYEKFGPPIVTKNERWVGPGHGTVVAVHGLDYLVYHAWVNAGDGTHDGAKGRHVLVDRIVWEGGWPKIHDGSPSRSQQPWPGVP